MIVINNEKAIEIAKNKIRVWRESEFKKNDLDIQDALMFGGDLESLKDMKQYLCDLPTECENKTVDELYNYLKHWVLKWKFY